MKNLQTVVIIIMIVMFGFVMFFIGSEVGIDRSKNERGTWVKVMDTTYHYEFKK